MILKLIAIALAGATLGAGYAQLTTIIVAQ
jgi:hypothetical protein